MGASPKNPYRSRSVGVCQTAERKGKGKEMTRAAETLKAHKEAQRAKDQTWKEIKDTMITALTMALQSGDLSSSETVEASRLLQNLVSDGRWSI